MKIAKTRSAAGAIGKAGAKKNTGSAGAVFSISQNHSAEKSASIAGIGGIQAVIDISALLAVQGVDDQSERKKAVDHGFLMLDALDDLKVDLLSGKVSSHKLSALATIVGKERHKAEDPELVDVLDQIELRARVELAKFEHNRD